jgi:hypothetical protein
VKAECLDYHFQAWQPDKVFINDRPEKQNKISVTEVVVVD